MPTDYYRLRQQQAEVGTTGCKNTDEWRSMTEKQVAIQAFRTQIEQLQRDNERLIRTIGAIYNELAPDLLAPGVAMDAAKYRICTHIERIANLVGL